MKTRLKALETIVEKLEEGELPLQESLSQFEKGVKLTRECQKMLAEAEQKVAVLSQDSENLEPFTEE